MSERLLAEFRDRAERLVAMPDLRELQKRGTRRRRIRVAASAAVLAFVLAIGGALAMSSSHEKNSISPTQSEDIARRFLDAYGAFDADRAMTHLTDNAVATSWGSPEKFRLEISYLKAIGYQQTITSCGPSPATPGSIRCDFDLQALRSDEIGLDPYPDNYWYLTLRDGKITSAVWAWGYNTNWFGRQLWEPFKRWLTTEHPGDIAVMYTEADRARLTPESIQLWEQRTKEYVTAVTRGPADYVDQPAVAAYIAQLKSICTTAHTRLNDELRAAGVKLEPAPNTDSITSSFPDATADVQFTVARVEDWPKYEEAARRILDETLPELRGLRPPKAIRPTYEGLAFALMERFARGGQAPYTPRPANWIFPVERLPGLYDCTFNLRR